MLTRVSLKDPDSVEPYYVVWCDKDGINNGSGLDYGELQGATIVTSSWEVVSGNVVIDSDSIAAISIHGTDYPTNTVAKVVLSGGENGTMAIVRNRITTTDGRILDKSIEIPIKHL